MKQSERSEDTMAHQHICIPAAPALTPEEISRRRAAIATIRNLQKQIGPLELDAVELIDADFYELDATVE